MKDLKVIENARVVLENGIILDGVVVTKGDRIVDFGKKGSVDIPTGADRIDAEGAYVGPGFVDIHVHGGGGYSTCYNPTEACEFFLEHGTTTLLATPDYHMNLKELMEVTRNINAAKGKARTMRGIYMECPYTNPNYGSHSYMNPWRGAVDPKEFKLFVDEAGKFVRVWTIAPERPDLLPFLEYARRVNPDVVFAVGHSEALPSQIRALGKYRPTIETHAMNATGRQNERPNAGIRSFGPDEYCYKEPDVYCELISDSQGIHVNYEMQRFLIHTKGYHRVILITDSTVHNNPAPPAFAHITDLNFDARGGIAGSKMTMEQACRNIMTHTNTGIAQAFLMASRNPAEAVGLGEELGTIAKGKRADLVFVDDIFNIKKVMLGGSLC